MGCIVFFDRDGTLIRDTGYLSDPDKVEPLPGAIEGLVLLSQNGIRLAVVSNQAGLAKGKFDEKQQAAVHARFVDLFGKAGVGFDAVEYCPHHPEGSIDRYRQSCSCRKPGTALADRIMTRLSVPPEWSRWVVGDKMIDIEMGKRIGAATILVATGYGPEERQVCDRSGIQPDAYLSDIKEAACWILSGNRNS